MKEEKVTERKKERIKKKLWKIEGVKGGLGKEREKGRKEERKIKERKK